MARRITKMVDSTRGGNRSFHAQPDVLGVNTLKDLSDTAAAANRLKRIMKADPR